MEAGNDLAQALKEAAIECAEATRSMASDSPQSGHVEELANAAKALTAAHVEAATMERKAKRSGKMASL